MPRMADETRSPAVGSQSTTCAEVFEAASRQLSRAPAGAIWSARAGARKLNSDVRNQGTEVTRPERGLPATRSCRVCSASGSRCCGRVGRLRSDGFSAGASVAVDLGRRCRPGPGSPCRERASTVDLLARSPVRRRRTSPSTDHRSFLEARRAFACRRRPREALRNLRRRLLARRRAGPYARFSTARHYPPRAACTPETPLDKSQSRAPVRYLKTVWRPRSRTSTGRLRLRGLARPVLAAPPRDGGTSSPTARARARAVGALPLILRRGRPPLVAVPADGYLLSAAA